jgi:4-amino-4-deoxy-L-arabinose transferase-like glycosyltransferase
VLEHPPGFVWMQSAVFAVFGFSDFLARLPSALCGVATILLLFFLTRRLLDERQALLATFVLLSSAYFVKYAAHGMMDVPFTMLYTGAVLAWVLAEQRRVWYAAVFLITAYALLMRGVVGLAVPLTLGLDWMWRRRAPTALLVLSAAFVPLVAWYAHLYALHGDYFFLVQGNFLRDKIAGDVTGIRRFTGAFEYAWMLAKSYWPWLPFLLVGLWTGWRDPRLRLPLIWSAVMFTACAIGGSRILRYLLPAYPPFSIFAAVGLQKVVRERWLDLGMRWLAPAAVVVAAGIALFPPVTMHAEETRPIAFAARSATKEGQRIGFYDAGDPRFDETGQIQWYGDRTMWILTDSEAFQRALAEPISPVWIVDAATFQKDFAVRPGASVVARNGHLVLVRLTAPAQP